MAEVLIVEDDKDSGEAIALSLRRAGHQPVIASNGAKALAAIVESRPKLIVLDIRMPEMDGIAFMKVLRSYLRWHDLPVVVVTAVGQGPELERIQEFNVSRTFIKAKYELADLTAYVNQLVGQRPN